MDAAALFMVDRMLEVTGAVTTFVFGIFVDVIQFWFVVNGQLLFHFAPENLNETVLSYCSNHQLFPRELAPPLPASSPSPPQASSPQPLLPYWTCIPDFVDKDKDCVLRRVSFRFKYGYCPTAYHVQGDLALQKFGDTGLHRLKVDAYFSVLGGDGKRTKGESFNYPILLPVHCRYTELHKVGLSEKSQQKHFLWKIEFFDNDDALESIQLFVNVATYPEAIAECFAFRGTLIECLNATCECTPEENKEKKESGSEVSGPQEPMIWCPCIGSG
ncbi:unknown protein [Seminavis robusta]|uniref:Uncharacterized protein n=1 Tax=Seminavis robusta TaxID=568900 RepID=A0A9N8EYE2_9STRA|nr:unknown protein [Seminavis robusta]|eukprot:Sro2087_g313910.1 n/a (273) ;mRNA; f:17101-17919